MSIFAKADTYLYIPSMMYDNNEINLSRVIKNSSDMADKFNTMDKINALMADKSITYIKDEMLHGDDLGIHNGATFYQIYHDATNKNNYRVYLDDNLKVCSVEIGQTDLKESSCIRYNINNKQTSVVRRCVDRKNDIFVLFYNNEYSPYKCKIAKPLMFSVHVANSMSLFSGIDLSIYNVYDKEGYMIIPPVMLEDKLYIDPNGKYYIFSQAVFTRKGLMKALHSSYNDYYEHSNPGPNDMDLVNQEMISWNWQVLRYCEDIMNSLNMTFQQVLDELSVY